MSSQNELSKATNLGFVKVEPFLRKLGDADFPGAEEAGAILVAPAGVAVFDEHPVGHAHHGLVLRRLQGLEHGVG